MPTYTPAFLVYHPGRYYETSLIKDMQTEVLGRNCSDDSAQARISHTWKRGSPRAAARGLPGRAALGSSSSESLVCHLSAASGTGSDVKGISYLHGCHLPFDSRAELAGSKSSFGVYRPSPSPSHTQPHVVTTLRSEQHSHSWAHLYKHGH